MTRLEALKAIEQIVQKAYEVGHRSQPEERRTNASGDTLSRYGSLMMNTIKPSDIDGEYGVDSLMKVADRIIKEEGMQGLEDDEDAYLDFVDSIGDYYRNATSQKDSGESKTFGDGK